MSKFQEIEAKGKGFVILGVEVSLMVYFAWFVAAALAGSPCTQCVDNVAYRQSVLKLYQNTSLIGCINPTGSNYTKAFVYCIALDSMV